MSLFYEFIRSLIILAAVGAVTIAYGAVYGRAMSSSRRIAHARTKAINAARNYITVSERLDEPIPDYVRALAAEQLDTRQPPEHRETVASGPRDCFAARNVNGGRKLSSKRRGGF